MYINLHLRAQKAHEKTSLYLLSLGFLYKEEVLLRLRGGYKIDFSACKYPPLNIWIVASAGSAKGSLQARRKSHDCFPLRFFC
jgi:hypothetical protein